MRCVLLIAAFSARQERREQRLLLLQVGLRMYISMLFGQHRSATHEMRELRELANRESPQLDYHFSRVPFSHYRKSASAQLLV